VLALGELIDRLRDEGREVVGVRHAAGQDEAVVVVGADLADGLVDREGVCPS
jgi:hypothetical protein